MAELNIITVWQLLETAMSEADAATAAFAAAQTELQRAREQKYEENTTPDGRVVMVPIARLIEQIANETEIPADALPAGRSAKDEREAARTAWLLKNNALYAAYTEQIEDADFSIQLATGAVVVAERASKTANEKMSAMRGMTEFLTAQMQNNTAKHDLENLRKQMRSAFVKLHDGFDKTIYDTGNKTPTVTSQPQEVDDGLF